jgi:hypothetical protein
MTITRTSLSNQYPGRQQTAAPRFTAAEIYAARAGRPAAQPKHRDTLCHAHCQQATNGFAACEETSVCKNLVRDASSPERRTR